jgi:hypothetical protein
VGLGIYECCLAYPAPSSRSAVIRMAMVVMVIVRPVFWIRGLINAYVTITKAKLGGQVEALRRRHDLGTCIAWGGSNG